MQQVPTLISRAPYLHVLAAGAEGYFGVSGGHPKCPDTRYEYSISRIQAGFYPVRHLSCSIAGQPLLINNPPCAANL